MCSNTHMLFMMSVYSLAVQADLCWLVAPDSIPASRSWWLVRADTGGWSLKWECWCTSNEISHRLPVHHWGGRECWKKALFFLCILIVHSDPPSCLFISPSIYIWNLCLSCWLVSALTSSEESTHTQAGNTCSFRCHRQSPIGCI